MAEPTVLPPDFARSLAPIAGFRNILVHEYLGIDWDEVYASLHDLETLHQFAAYVVDWMHNGLK